MENQVSIKKKNDRSQEHVVFLGEARFPYGLAAIQRMILMSKALLHEDIKVSVVCRKGSWKENEYPNFDYKGVFEGINYIYTSKIVFKPKGFLRRNIVKIKGAYGEYTYLKDQSKNNRIDLAIVSNRKLLHVLRYLFFARHFNFPIVLNLVEMASAMKHRSGFWTQINDWLLDKWVIKWFDGALPISNKLLEYYKSVSPDKPYMKVPIICDFEKFEVSKQETEKYFLYCGSIGFREVIDFIIESFKRIIDDNNVKLFMIVSGGTKKQTLQLEQEINSFFVNDPVILFSNIPYNELVDLYRNAAALLIPLRPTIQDASRFPHKIGEYLASGNPVITTNIGEIKNYFEDGKTALVSEKYEISEFADKMKFVLNNAEEAIKIGDRGKELGLREFDFKRQGKRLKKFIIDIKS